MKKLIVAITGASGSIYAYHLINDILQFSNYPISLIFSENGKKVWDYELNIPLKDILNDRIVLYNNTNMFAPPASGSAQYDAMVIIPCSMGTLGRIANGISYDLISRSADVMLKEKKQLIIVPRELPYHQIHLENMLKLAHMQTMIVPASPSFYSKPKSINDLVETVTNRILRYLGINKPGFKWGENTY